MKKYFIRGKGQQKRPHYPFWMPWGGLGCLGRVVGFMLSLAALMLLLWFLGLLIPHCNRSDNDDPEATDPEEIEEIVEQPIELPDTVPNNNPDLPNTPVPGIPGPMPQPTNPIQDPEDPVREIDANQLLVIIDPQDKSNEDVLQQFVSEFKALYPGDDYQVIYANPSTMLTMLSVPEDRRAYVRDNLQGQITDIRFFIEDVSVFGDFANRKGPNDPALKDDEAGWYFNPILAPEGWAITTGDNNVKVAVIDSYFDLTHPDFYGLDFEKPVSFENGTANVLPPQGPDSDLSVHGTHVLGIIAGQMNNGILSSGIAPDVTVIPISLGTNMNNASIAEAILYALYNGASVINLSLGGSLSEEVLDKMSIADQVNYSKTHGQRGEAMWKYIMDLLEKRNCIAVFASGNEHCYTLIDNMKRTDNIINVDAVGPDLRKTDFSNFGNVPGERHSVISAPGKDICSTIPWRRGAFLDGTSMAAPVVTGAVALMKSLDPTLSNNEVIEILKTTAKPLPDKNIGPLIQIGPALEEIKKRQMDWDEFVKNPKGLYKSAMQIEMVNIETQKFMWYVHQYMIFETPTSGILEAHVLGEDVIYNTRFAAQIDSDKASLTFSPMLTPDGKCFVPKGLVLFPDEDRKIRFSYIDNNTNKPKSNSYPIKKLKKDDRVNTNKRDI